MIKGIDISKWQGDINFAQVKQSVSFVVMKATEGVGYVDPRFRQNQSGARNAGLLVGYYHFMRPDLGNTAVKEADWFIDTVGELREGEIMCLDFEAPYSNPSAHRGYARQFLDRVRDRVGFNPLIYMNKSTVDGYDWTQVIAGNYGLWLAIYPKTVDLNNPIKSAKWGTTAMWQYSSTGRVAGIFGNVDLNVFYGDEATFKKYGKQVSQPTTDNSNNQSLEGLKQQLIEKNTRISILEKEVIAKDKRVEEAIAALQEVVKELQA